ncbi:MAG TPA: glycosyltransferase family 39 protein [Acidobacteriaceae bacterium]
MSSFFHRVRRVPQWLAGLPSLALFAILFAAVVLSHLTLLRLPYYWDEGGYYIPAALDFYHRFTLIPEFTNAHPPLPNVVLGTLWHVTGYHILATRLMVAAFAAVALLALFRLTQRLIGASAAVVVTALTAIYPIWFAQSTLAHADIFAAAFTLAGFACYFSLLAVDTPNGTGVSTPQPSSRTMIAVAALFSLAALSKETAIVEPAALALIQFVLLLLHWRKPQQRQEHLRWLAALCFPVLPLALWFAYHHHATGFTFGNPEYLRYNATANFTWAHIFLSLKYRAMHLFWQRNMYVPWLLTLAAFLLPRRKNIAPLALRIYTTFAVLLVVNWGFFSVLGGALLTRYLLPVYALMIFAQAAAWRERTSYWPAFAALTAAAFIPALWINGPHAMAPEDNLTYRDMIVVQQQAIDFLNAHDPDAHVITAWPVAAALVRPELGYSQHIFHVTSMDNFTRPEVMKAAARPGDYDTMLAFTTKYEPPEVLNQLAHTTDTTRLAAYDTVRDLTPEELARVLHGTIVWQTHIGGEWSAVLRFPRRYNVDLTMPALPQRQ